MCGLVGIWSPHAGQRNLVAAVAALAHRGPDGRGLWADAEQGVALGHTRLAILDLTPAGQQPMHSACGRLVIVFNGEIYNHLDLRRELERAQAAPEWRGHSDTETLLAGFVAWGVEATLKRCVGMFALALWDRSERTLSLARDRFGEKPLYWGRVGGALAFASELKALRVLPGFDNPVDRDALAMFTRHGYVPGPRSIYQGIGKLPPGHWLTLKSGEWEAPPRPYWSMTQAIAAARRDPWVFNDDAEAVSALAAVLSEAVSVQMLADVPLGAFLSGGVDSSTIVALMQSLSGRPVKTFSIGFRETGYDEAPHAAAVARHLGTEHTELYVSPAEAQAVIPLLPTMYDEPFADSSQIPTHLVSRMARNHVTVALSGDAGDELFGGYQRYFLAARLWGRLSRVPRPLRRLAASGILGLRPAIWDRLALPLRPVLPRSWRQHPVGDKLHKGARLLDAADSRMLYQQLVSYWEPARLMPGAGDGVGAWAALSETAVPGLALQEQMMLADTMSYLPDDILVKVDRAAMACSLETRVPMLDHRVFEFAWRLPLHYQIRGGEGKWLLRQVLYRHVPRGLIERPKMGFGVPVDAWLRGPLRDWAEALLDARRLREEGFFDPTVVRQFWAQHQSGARNWSYHLWTVLMFQAWQEAQREPLSGH